MKTAAIALNSRWQAPGDNRVFVVTEKKPFGQMVIKQEDRHYYGETTKQQFLATFKQVAA